MTRYIRWFPVIVIMVMLTLNACSASRSPSTPTVIAELTDTPSPVSLTPTTSPNTETQDNIEQYENMSYGFSFQYPTSFHLEELSVQPGVPLRLGLTTPGDSGTPNQYEPALGVIVYENAEQHELNDWVNRHLGDPPEIGQPPEQAVVFFSPNIENRDPFQGYPALQYESSAWPIRYETLIAQNGWIIGVYYHRDHSMDYESAYRAILASLKIFTPNLPTPTLVQSTPTSVACLDEAAEPRTVLARKEPLEVRFISDGNIWIWNEGVDAHQVTNTGDAIRFSVSPDGQVIAFERATGTDPSGIRKVELWAVNRNGSELKRLVSVEQFDQLYSEQQNPTAWAANLPTDYRWLPGTHQLSFGIYPAFNALGWSPVAVTYWVVDTSTQNLSAWSQAEKIDPFAPHRLISPDGSKIAIIDRESISLVYANGSSIREDAVTYPASPCGESPCWLAPRALWTDDSSTLRVAVWEANEFGEQERFSTWEIPADGRPARKIATFNGMPYSIYLSPNQKYIAYLNRATPTSNQLELHLAFFDGSRDLLFVVGYLLQAQGWAPDSLQFVYTQSSEQQPWLAMVCGPAQHLVDSTDGPSSNITWLDENRFLYIQSPMGESGPLRIGQVGGPSQYIGPTDGHTLFYEVR